MTQQLTKRRTTRASLRTHEAARTVLLRMAQDSERAERIRDLKAMRPDLRWRKIAEHVGVTERSALSWAKNGGIAYDNVRKLAELFDVDPDWLWNGAAKENAPEIMRSLSRSNGVGTDEPVEERLASIEGKLDRQNELMERYIADRRAEVRPLVAALLRELAEADEGQRLLEAFQAIRDAPVPPPDEDQSQSGH